MDEILAGVNSPEMIRIGAILLTKFNARIDMASKPHLWIKLTGILLITGAFICIFISWRKYNTIEGIIQTSERHVGTVVGFDEHRQDEVTKMEYAPIFEYEVNEEKKLIHTSQFSFQKDFETNELVIFYISRNEPSKVFINSFSERWSFILIVTGAGVVLLVLGTVMLFAKFRER